jgi:ribonuclease HI
VAIIKIVCDASYKEKLWFSGYAGLINIERKKDGGTEPLGNPETLMYQGVAAEQSTSQEGEVLAILAGLRELEQRELGRDDEVLYKSTINIHSDCQGAISLIRDYNEDEASHSLESQYLREIMTKSAKYGWKLNTHHVPSHVPNHKATGIQKLNNFVDERARKTLDYAIARMLNPHTKPSKNNAERVAILLPTKPLNADEGKAWALLATNLAEKGKRMHIYIEGNPAQHPFLNALESFAQSKSINLAKVARVYSYMPDFLRNPLNKRDLTLTRYHMLKRNLNTNAEFTDSEVHIRAALASRLIYGDPTPSVMPSDFSGRKTPAVNAVYDLMSPITGPDYTLPNNVQGWMHTFLKYVDIPSHHGLKNALSLEGINLPNLSSIHNREKLDATSISDGAGGNTDCIPQQEDELFEAFKEIYINTKGQVKPNQLAHLFIDEFKEHGYALPEMAKSSIEIFVYATGKKDTNEFINRVIKQMQKLSPKPAGLAFTDAPKVGAIIDAPEISRPSRR